MQDWYKVENGEGKQGFVPANHLKRAEPVIKSSQERLAEEARTVSDRQKQIEKQYADLTEAARKKERALKLRIEMYKVSGNAKNLINWTTKKVCKIWSNTALRLLNMVQMRLWLKIMTTDRKNVIFSYILEPKLLLM